MNPTENKDELYVLIHSLTKAEKRFFKLSSARYKKEPGNKYIALFGIIDRQKNYNEAAIVRNFRASTYFKQPAAAKNYLYNLIMQTLEHYNRHEKRTPANKLKQAIILYKKGLYEQSRKMLLAARAEAKKREEFHVIMNSLELERNLIRSTMDIQEIDASLDFIIEEEKKCIDRINELNNLKLLESRVLKIHYRQRLLRNKEEKKQYSFMVNDLLKLNVNALKSNSAKYIAHLSRSVYYLTCGEYPESYKALLQLHKIFQSNPEFGNAHPEYRLKTINDSVVIAYMLKRYDDSLNYIAELEKMCLLYPDNKTFKVAVFSQYNTQLAIYLNTYNYEKGLAFIRDIEHDIIESNIMDEFSTMLFYYNEACIFFGLEKYHESLKRINMILNSPVTDKSYISLYVRIVQLILLFELEEYELLEYRTRSFYRFLIKQGSPKLFEKTLISFIKHSMSKINITHNEDVRKGLLHLKQMLLKTFVDNPSESDALNYFDFIPWLESKIQKRPFIDVVKENKT